MSKHTPGPWRNAGNIGAAAWIVGGYPTNQRQIAAVYGLSITPESVFNASLIAAAPDLLAACEAAADLIDKNSNRFEDPSTAGAVWRQLAEAIAKAQEGDL